MQYLRKMMAHPVEGATLTEHERNVLAMALTAYKADCFRNMASVKRLANPTLRAEAYASWDYRADTCDSLFNLIVPMDGTHRTVRVLR